MDENTLLFRSGDFFLPKDIVVFLDKYIFGNDSTVMYINHWSIIHMISGMIVGFTTGNLFHAITLHTLWELWQLNIKMTKVSLRGFIDVSMDTVMFVIGFLIVKKLKNIQ